MKNNPLLEIKNKQPLILCLTNLVTANDIANIILGMGASPLMAYEEDVVKDVVPISKAILINLGTPVVQYKSTLLTSCKLANKLNIPIVLDPVGVGCISKHYWIFKLILSKHKVAMIKGNAAEIFFIFSNNNKSNGLDSDYPFNNTELINACKVVAIKYKTIVLATGPTDVLTDGKDVFLIKNGTRAMTKITGTGCVLGAIIAIMLSVTNKLEELAKVVALFNIAGEESYKKFKNNYFQMKIHMYDLFLNLDLANATKKQKIVKSSE